MTKQEWIAGAVIVAVNAVLLIIMFGQSVRDARARKEKR
jgi:hypothetical protein